MNPRVKYTDEVKARMKELSFEGLTYEEIGKIYGISKQRVFQIIGSRDVRKWKYIKPEDCVWIGIWRWMNQNRISMAELCRLYYGNSMSENRNRLKRRLKNENVRNIDKLFIDKMLAITGLTYEEAFAVAE